MIQLQIAWMYSLKGREEVHCRRYTYMHTDTIFYYVPTNYKAKSKWQTTGLLS